jgi:hypothetical protein
MRLQVWKDDKFSSVGGDVLPIDFGAKGYVRQWILKPALSPDGTPYIVYNKYDENNDLYMLYYENGKGWVGPTKIMDAPEGTASDLNLAFDAKGVGYLTFTDKANKIHLLQYADADPAQVVRPAKTVAEKTEFFDLSGKRYSAPAKGLSIERKIGADGSVTTKKVLK